MDGPRPPHANEYESLVHFLDQNLRDKYDWSITQEYPTALNPQNLGNLRIIKEGGEILAHALFKPLLIRTSVGMFKVAAIGSVVTSEKYRHKGLSRMVMENCITAAREQSCDFAILWTNLYEFYRRFGFELAGTEINYTLEKELPVPNTNLKVLHGPQVAPEAILRLFSQHTVASIRTFDEIKKYLQIPNSNIYTAWDHLDTLQAYAVEGKGADLQGYVHEWGGGLSHLFPMINQMLRARKAPLHLIVPRHSTNMIRKLEQWKIPASCGFLGMIKIISAPTIFGKITRAARAEHGLMDFSLEKRESTFCIHVNGKTFQTDSEADIVRLIFGPQSPNEIYPFDTATSSVLEKILPLPIWIWGWDSV